MLMQARPPVVKKLGLARYNSERDRRIHSDGDGMATSESDADFESADEELGASGVKRNTRTAVYWTTSPTTVDSESDDEYVQRAPCDGTHWQRRAQNFRATPDAPGRKITPIGDKDDKTNGDVKVESDRHIAQSVDVAKTSNKQETSIESGQSTASVISTKDKDIVESSKNVQSDVMSKVEDSKIKKVSQTKQRQDTTRQLDAKKLGTRFAKDNADESHIATEQENKCSAEYSNEKSLSSTWKKDTEYKMEEKSKTQVAVFQPEGWEGLGDDIELPDELTEEKLQPVLQRLSLANKEEGKDESSLGSWGSWGNWGVTSLINTATASVSTLTNHMSQGFTLLEDTIKVQEPTELERTKEQDVATPDELEIQEQESRSYSSFGFGNLISGVSSITKLVESTGSKVMTGGLDTLEAIGKKTMEVLQDGDPGLKKKRAFFMNEIEKPNLSQILREAKEKAETEEKTIEERELARKVHFESLFDDYQGLVHLEALEMLSKQSNMKIQQHLIELNANDLTSVQETLEEIKELCDLGDDEDDEEKDNKDFKNRLENACHDLGVDITYEKLYGVWTETENYLESSSMDTDQIFQNAISTLARFTAFSVERFHKTAELLLIKERRSTVNEADALVQLTNILSNQISSLANLFCDTLQQFAKSVEKPNINANITTIFLEASNANSYIQDAFRLLIPILQVGAI
ncbi:protein FAM114A2 isoform X2 [Pogonomyrmex barbatus]|uniref:Protein FAM114A2 isoform X2 n=1 Tax=Pogonomyrmex barbatus TaxID=144034 RepID=A0A6I9VSQ8_9HYME|nr:protein FAM114A2 isoform X2 [Pogonomyrmex barbatus]